MKKVDFQTDFPELNRRLDELITDNPSERTITLFQLLSYTHSKFSLAEASPVFDCETYDRLIEAFDLDEMMGISDEAAERGLDHSIRFHIVNKSAPEQPTQFYIGEYWPDPFLVCPITTSNIINVPALEKLASRCLQRAHSQKLRYLQPFAPNVIKKPAVTLVMTQRQAVPEPELVRESR